MFWKTKAVEPSAILTKAHVQFDQMGARHIKELLLIEREGSQFPWTEREFRFWLHQRNCGRAIVIHNNRIVGFFIYELQRREFRIATLVVAPHMRRQGIGTQILFHLIDKLFFPNRHAIVIEVRETNVAAQLFLRKQGLKATRILRKRYGDTNEDAYEMRYSVLNNRITEYI